MKPGRFEELLEEALLSRRSLVPPADRFVAGVFAAVATPARSRAARWLDVMMSGPALAFIGFVVVGLWTYWHQAGILAFLERPVGGVVLSERLSGILSIDGLGGAISTMTHALPGGDVVVLTAVYSIVTVAILALTGVMTLRFVRN